MKTQKKKLGLFDRALAAIGLKRDFTGAGNASPNGSFPAAMFGRLVSDWMSNGLSADRVADGNIKTLRDRSRQLERANDYFVRFLADLQANVLGSSGILLSMKVKDDNGKLDNRANDIIEERWQKFHKKGNFEVTGDYSGYECQKLGLMSAARDGEYLIRKLKNWDNPWRFTCQFWEADLLDHKYNVNLPNGHKVRLGVERDAWGRRVAYYIFENHPGDYYWDGNRTRVDASEIIHVMNGRRFGASRSYPWATTSMRKLHMLEQYEETELIASRVAAAKMGFFIPKTPADWDGEQDERGDVVMDAEPGIFEELPQGMEFQKWDPTHPNADFQGFRKAMLRSIASGLLMSYNFLASDLEGVNYTSLRAGAMSDREIYKMIQVWFVNSHERPIFEEWLNWSMISGVIKLPITKFDKFNNPVFRCRRWGWVDPLKEVQANVLAVDNLMKSRTSVVEESGETDSEYETILDDIQKENELIEDRELSVTSASGAKPTEEEEEPDSGTTPPKRRA